MEILGYDKSEIVKLAFEYQNELFDGVVQYDYEEGKLFGCSMSTNTIENPENPFIEIFRLEQGERGIIDYRMGCGDECPFNCDFEGFDKSLYPNTWEECCMEAYIDDGFEDDWNDNHKQGVEQQIRDIVYEELSDDIDNLNEIWLLLHQEFDSVVVFEEWLLNDYPKYKMNVMDGIIEGMIEYGINNENWKEYLYDETIKIGEELNHLGVWNKIENNEWKWYNKIYNYIENYEFEKARKLLKNFTRRA